MVAPFNSRNVFDRSRPAFFSCNPCKLVPNFYEEVYPGDHFRCIDENITKLAPLVGPVYGMFDIYQWYFFVPFRLVWKDWQNYITGGKYGNDSPNRDGSNPYIKPYVMLTNPSHKSLAAYLGMASKQTYPDQTTYNPGTYKVDAMPFRAIQLIWNEWFRNENLQDEVEISLEGGQDTTVNTTTLLNKNWERDRFTSALPWQQRGDPTYLPLDIEAPVVGNGRPLLLWPDGSETTPTGNSNGYLINRYGDSGTSSARLAMTTNGSSHKAGDVITNANFNDKTGMLIGVATTGNSGMVADLTQATAVTVDQVRTAFQIQQFLYNSGRRGYRYVEQILSLFGVRAPDASLQRPQFIGGYRAPVNISEVIQTSETTNSSPQGNLSGLGRGWTRKLGFNQKFNEYGMVIGLYCMMPKIAYNGQGLPKVFTRETKYDYLVPPLAHLSMDAVLNKELRLDSTGGDTVNNAVFGYQDRYDELRYAQPTVAGDFLTSLNFWTNTRIFKNQPALNSEFVTASYDFRNFAVTDEDVDHLWVTTYHHVKAVRPLPKHGNPGFIDHM